MSCSLSPPLRRVSMSKNVDADRELVCDLMCLSNELREKRSIPRVYAAYVREHVLPHPLRRSFYMKGPFDEFLTSLLNNGIETEGGYEIREE